MCCVVTCRGTFSCVLTEFEVQCLSSRMSPSIRSLRCLTPTPWSVSTPHVILCVAIVYLCAKMRLSQIGYRRPCLTMDWTRLRHESVSSAVQLIRKIADFTDFTTVLHRSSTFYKCVLLIKLLTILLISVVNPAADVYGFFIAKLFYQFFFTPGPPEAPPATQNASL